MLDSVYDLCCDTVGQTIQADNYCRMQTGRKLRDNLNFDQLKQRRVISNGYGLTWKVSLIFTWVTKMLHLIIILLHVHVFDTEKAL